MQISLTSTLYGGRFKTLLPIVILISVSSTILFAIFVLPAISIADCCLGFRFSDNIFRDHRFADDMFRDFRFSDNIFRDYRFADDMFRNFRFSDDIFRDFRARKYSSRS